MAEPSDFDSVFKFHEWQEKEFINQQEDVKKNLTAFFKNILSTWVESSGQEEVDTLVTKLVEDGAELALKNAGSNGETSKANNVARKYNRHKELDTAFLFINMPSSKTVIRDEVNLPLEHDQMANRMQNDSCKALFKGISSAPEKNPFTDVVVKTYDDLRREANDFFESTSLRAKQSVIVLNGHGSTMGILSEEETNPMSWEDLIKLFNELKAEAEELPEGCPSISLAYLFLANCFSYLAAPFESYSIKLPPVTTKKVPVVLSIIRLEYKDGMETDVSKVLSSRCVSLNREASKVAKSFDESVSDTKKDDMPFSKLSLDED